MPKTPTSEDHDHEHDHHHETEPGHEHVHGEHCSHGARPILVEKIGRNDPCKCNSGKKYKKCCGAAK